MALDVIDGGGDPATVKTTLDGSDHVTHHHVDSSALPSGAATSANQSTIISAVDGLEALVTTLDSVLDAINAKLAALGQAAMAASVPVTVASDQSAVPVSAASLPLPTGAATSANQSSVITALAAIATEATLATIDTVLDAINGKLAALGQAAMAGSMPVAIASNQTAIPVTDNSSTLSVDDGGGALTVDGTVAVSSVSGSVTAVGAAADGAATSGNPVLIAGHDSSLVQTLFVDSNGRIIATGGAAHDATAANAGNPMNVAAYASAAAPSDVSGDGDVVRLWALRNGALVGQLSAAGALIGGDASNGLDVDVTRLPALPAGTNTIGSVQIAAPSAAAHTNVASAATDTELLDANTSRRGFAIYNDSTQVLYLKYGTGASATSYVTQIGANGYFEDPWGWQGVVHGIWASANGNARITEIT